MATLPSRVGTLEKVIDSLYDQCDRMRIMLNGHFTIPECCNDSKIVPIIMDNSMGDLAKFYWLENYDGYVFTVDDDLIYPPDHVSKMIGKIDYYDKKYPVSVHGAIKKPGKLKSYYGDTVIGKDNVKLRYHWSFRNKEDVIIDAGGTGGMGWHSDTGIVSYDEIVKQIDLLSKEWDCKPADLIDMADIWFRYFFDEIVCIEHQANYFELLDYQENIYNSYYLKNKKAWQFGDPIFNDYYQTRLFNHIARK